MKEQNVFIGNTSKEGIYHYKFKDGNLTRQYATDDFERCTYLTQNDLYLYSVVEVADVKNHNNGYVLAYKKHDNKIINIDKKSSYGQGPCHIELDNNKGMLFISNYIDGHLTIMKLNSNGTIGKKVYSYLEEKQVSHLHCVKTCKGGEFFLTTDLGTDIVTAYEMKENEIKEISRVKLKEGTQPRHLVIGEDKVYVITEKSCELYILKFENRKLSILDVVSILPKGIQKQSDYTGCAIKISKDFKNIYTTIRGHNSISIFEIEESSVKMIQNISCEGKLPRDLCLDKFEEYVLIANQESNEITIFERDKENGKIRLKSKEKINSPTCVIIE